MQKLLPLFTLILILGYAFYNAMFHNPKMQKKTVNTSSIKQHHSDYGTDTREELSRLHSDTYLKQYIMDVINHGSSQLHFKKDEIMEAGFAPREDVEKIACYVMAFSGHKCDRGYPTDAAGFYTSICGGCHGNDGKGINGTYPDLSRDPLLGMQQREVWLRSRVAP